MDLPARYMYAYHHPNNIYIYVPAGFNDVQSELVHVHVQYWVNEFSIM